MNTTFLDVMFFYVSVELCAEGAKKVAQQIFSLRSERDCSPCVSWLGRKVSDNGHKASYTDGESVWLLYGIVRNNRPWHYTEYLMGN